MLNFDNLNIILFILPVYQMMFYAVQLITLRKNNNPLRRPLGALMLLIMLYLVVNASRYLGYDYLYSFIFTLQLPLLLGIIPTYYLYLRALSNSSDGIFSKHPIVFYLPAIFMFLLNVVAFVNIKPDQSDAYLSSGFLLSGGDENTMGFAMLVFLLGNAGFVGLQLIIAPLHYFRIMRGLRRVWKNSATYLPHLQKWWTHVIFFSVLAFVLLSSVMNFLTPGFNHFLSAIINLGFLITGGLAGYLGLKQDKLYIEVASVETEKPNGDATVIQSATVQNADNIPIEAVTREEANDIIERLQHCMVSDKLYIEKNMGPGDLADKMGINKQKLTYVVNNVMKTNFYGIINKHRVIEAKRLLRLPQNQNYNIDVISEMVGFQSKSSFNGCFKKITGQTPSQFRKENGKNGNGILRSE